MKLLQTLIYLLPSMLGIVSAAILSHEGKDWGWFLLITLIMFLIGIAASSPNPNPNTKGSEQ